MMTRAGGTWRRAMAVALGCGLGGVSAYAAQLQLKDDTRLSGDVLQTDDDSVIVRLPRAHVATVDGQPLPPALIAGVSAPLFAGAKDLQGRPQSLSADSGHVTLLHFWVHWCPHCRSDAPQLQALYDRFKDDPKVRILTVNLDQERAKLDAFLAEHHVTYPVIVAADQAAAGGPDLPALYHIQSFPATFIIDAQGIIKHKITGSFVESQQDVAAQLQTE